MTHRTSPKFWEYYNRLPEVVRQLADENFELLKQNPRHPSLHFKAVGDYLSVRVGLAYRALGVQSGDDVIWFWMGHHAEYDQIVSR